MSDAKKQDIYEEIKGQEARRIRYKILAVIGVTVLLIAGFAYATSNINIIHGPTLPPQTITNTIYTATVTSTNLTETTLFEYTATVSGVATSWIASSTNTTIHCPQVGPPAC